MTNTHDTQRSRRRRAHRRRGTTALELVCVLPVLLAIVLGGADLGRFAQYENVLSNAARTGAEYGATHRRTLRNADTWEERLIEIATEEAAHLPEFDPGLFEVTVDAVAQADGSLRVEVVAAYPFDMTVDWPGFPAQIELRQTIVYQEYR